VLLASAPVHVRSDAPYSILRLPPLSSLDDSPPRALPQRITNEGVILGKTFRTYYVSYSPNIQDATRWDAPYAQPTRLGHFPEEENSLRRAGSAIGMDASGTVYGTVTRNEEFRAVKWPAGSSVPIELPGLGPTIRESAHLSAVLADGTAVGSIGFKRAVMWSPGAPQPIDLTEGEALDISESGVIVGRSGYASAASTSAWRLRLGGGQRENLLTNYYGAEACAVNDAGLAVGASYIPRFLNPRPVVWEPESTQGIELKGPSATYPIGYASDVNNAGAIVGEWSPDGSLGDAALWTPGSYRFIDLNSWIDGAGYWDLYSATSINDKGQIVGRGKYDPDGPQGPAAALESAFLMNPKPLLADANGDMTVDFRDFQILEANFGAELLGHTERDARARGDFNTDGSVNDLDFGILKQQFGWWIPSVPPAGGASVTSVPEPGLALIGFAVVMLLRRHGFARGAAEIARNDSAKLREQSLVSSVS
jgi:hypothetical protein